MRPLSLGEVLDRAVTLCVRFFVPLASLYVMFAVPYAIAQYFATRNLAPVLERLSAMLQIQAATGRPVDPTLLSSVLAHQAALGPWLGCIVLADFVIAPLVVAALIEATATFYLGGTTTFSASYRVAMSRWLPLIGLNCLYLGAFIALYLVAATALTVIIIGVAFAWTAAHGVAIALGILFGVTWLLFAFALAVVFFFALEMSYFTCVVERMPALRAFGVGFRRVSGRSGLRRSLLVGAAYVAVILGAALLSGVGNALIAGLSHSDVLAALYAFCVRVAVATFLTAFFAVFYFDLRVRDEGLDLQVAAQRSAAHSLA